MSWDYLSLIWTTYWTFKALLVFQIAGSFSFLFVITNLVKTRRSKHKPIERPGWNLLSHCCHWTHGTITTNRPLSKQKFWLVKQGLANNTNNGCNPFMCSSARALQMAGWHCLLAHPNGKEPLLVPTFPVLLWQVKISAMRNVDSQGEISLYSV